jgi:predicted RNA binding protein YcfA (HicA-like mRNA interferase family)
VIAMKVRIVIATLKKAGWKLNRQKGSHKVFVHPNFPHHIVIAGNPGSEIKPGTLHGILKDAGLEDQ